MENEVGEEPNEVYKGGDEDEFVHAEGCLEFYEASLILRKGLLIWNGEPSEVPCDKLWIHVQSQRSQIIKFVKNHLVFKCTNRNSYVPISKEKQ